jgi:hypothetical protein
VSSPTSRPTSAATLAAAAGSLQRLLMHERVHPLQQVTQHSLPLLSAQILYPACDEQIK